MKRFDLRVDIMSREDVYAIGLLPAKDVEEIAPGTWLRVTCISPAIDHATAIDHVPEEGEDSPSQILGWRIIDAARSLLGEDARYSEMQEATAEGEGMVKEEGV